MEFIDGVACLKEVTVLHADIGALVPQSGCEQEGLVISRQLPPMLECDVKTVFVLLDHDVMNFRPDGKGQKKLFGITLGDGGYRAEWQSTSLTMSATK